MRATLQLDIARVAELWRYPVKSMRGESCSSLTLDASGVVGDRRFAITSSRAPAGKPLLASDERAAMLLYQPRLTADGSVRVTTPDRRGFDLLDPALLRHMEADLPVPTRLEVIHSTHAKTDVRPIAFHSMGTSAALAEVLLWPRGVIDRRLRSNVLLDFAANVAFEEDSLAGKILQIGSAAELLVLERIPRCRIVALDPETSREDRQILFHLAHSHGARAGVYARSIKPGSIAIGDSVRLAG